MNQHDAGPPDAAAQQQWRDVRLVGFPDRASLATAWQWLDAIGAGRDTEDVAAAEAGGRVLAASATTRADLPPADQVAMDGYAVRAADTEGASAYNPLPLRLSDTFGAGRACLVSAGTTLPPGSDAVLGFAAVSRTGPRHLEVLEQVAPGEGVAARGSTLQAGAAALPAGHLLRPQDLALLMALGIERVAVRRRPVVRLAIAGAKEGGADALGPMLRALVARDGGRPMEMPLAALTAIATPDPAEIVIVAGRSGTGADDDAASSLVEAGGSIALHGIALRPGGSSGLGLLRGVPVLLLPGDPLSCLSAYDMLAARLIRRLAGLRGGLPYATTRLKLARKIVSAIGLTDVVPVAAAGGEATPTASAGEGRLPAACHADGFVVVPETLEGHAEGETVRVHLYDPA